MFGGGNTVSAGGDVVVFVGGVRCVEERGLKVPRRHKKSGQGVFWPCRPKGGARTNLALKRVILAILVMFWVV